MMDYYVYEVYYCGILAYIGQGQGDRLDHVHSGRSHNKLLNEVYYRNQIFGEPKVEVQIRKRYRTRKEALSAEKHWIGRLKPLFNYTHSRNCKAKLFTHDEYCVLNGVGKGFLEAVEVFEAMCVQVGVNPKLALTPIGATVWGLPYLQEEICFNLAGLSLTGKCEQMSEYFDWVFVRDGVVKVWLKSFVMQHLVSELGWGYYVFEFDKKHTGSCLIASDGFDHNEYGSAVPLGYLGFQKSGLILCRTIGSRSAVRMVLAIYDTEGGYRVICENSQQLVYLSDTLGDALRVFRWSELRGENFVLLDQGKYLPICPIDLSNVLNFDKPTTLQIP